MENRPRICTCNYTQVLTLDSTFLTGSFTPDCPNIAESERIDCTPGQVVTEVSHGVLAGSLQALFIAKGEMVGCLIVLQCLVLINKKQLH